MAKLRHLALQVPDLEKAAAFYERCFDMKRVNKVSAPIGDAVVLSDGVMNLTLLNFPEGAKGMLNGPNWARPASFRLRGRQSRAVTEKGRSGRRPVFYEAARLSRGRC